MEEKRHYQERDGELFKVRDDCLSGPLALKERIAVRVAELKSKKRLSKAEREELAILTYDGPVARQVAFSDEVPF